MEFLNLGWMEFVLILILAFIILGPEKMVATGRRVGGWIRKLSRDKLFREVVETTDEIRRYPCKIFEESWLDMPMHVEQQRAEEAEASNTIDPLTKSQSDENDPD